MILVGSTILHSADLLNSKRSKHYIESKSDKDFIFNSEEEKRKFIKTMPFEKIDGVVSPEAHKLLKQMEKLQSNYSLKDSIAIRLLTLKLSHMHYDLKNNSWNKHLTDILYLFELGYKPNNEYLLKLKQVWTEFYRNKDKIKLNKSPQEFFTADYNQNHDTLHEYYMFGSEPVFKKFLKDGSEISVDKSKFDNLSDQDKLYSVIEESMVVAHERNLNLINGFKHVFTKLSKGWWNDYITLNFKTVIEELHKHSKTFNTKRKAYASR